MNEMERLKAQLSGQMECLKEEEMVRVIHYFCKDYAGQEHVMEGTLIIALMRVLALVVVEATAEQGVTIKQQFNVLSGFFTECGEKLERSGVKNDR